MVSLYRYLRMRRAIRVLKPWWGPRLDLAYQLLKDDHDMDSRDGGYRQGVYSTLNSLVYLNFDHMAYEGSNRDER